MKDLDDKYDVIIIGAGIGGLVCGCYLAKAGMKVLIVEKNPKPGGYCTSFKRNGFTFDTGIHYFGGCREKGKLRQILHELGLIKKIKIIRFNPSDVIITDDHTISIKNDVRETIVEFQESFPHQAKEIKKFFEYIVNTDYISLYLQLRGKTFRNLLDKYFHDEKLKAIFSISLANLGLPSSIVSGLAAATLYREFIFDGGYYPKGGMQSFSNALSERFQEFGGQLALSNKVQRISINDKKVEGVLLKRGLFIRTNYVVSNCDSKQTFLILVGKNHLAKKMINKLDELVPSPSLFIVYLGVNINLKEKLKNHCGHWYFPKYEADNHFKNSINNIIDFSDKCVFCSIPSFYDSKNAPMDGESLHLIITVPFKDEKYWQKNKIPLAENVIKRAEDIIPNLSRCVVIKEVGTPQALYRHTLNHNGAVYGWASTVSQTDSSLIPQETSIDGLMLAGHWITQEPGQGGVTMVAQSGRNAAKTILKKIPKQFPLESVLEEVKK